MPEGRVEATAEFDIIFNFNDDNDGLARECVKKSCDDLAFLLWEWILCVGSFVETVQKWTRRFECTQLMNKQAKM